MSLNEYTLKHANDGDVDLLIDLGKTTFRDTFGPYNTREDMDMYLQSAFEPEKVKAEIHEQDGVIMLAYHRDVPAGYAKVRSTTCPDGLLAKKPMEIERLYVQRDYLKRGVGSFLMQQCLNYARQHNHDVVWLGVWEHNARAIAFYEKWRFEKFGQHVFLLGSDPQNDYLMKRSVNTRSKV